MPDRGSRYLATVIARWSNIHTRSIPASVPRSAAREEVAPSWWLRRSLSDRLETQRPDSWAYVVPAVCSSSTRTTGSVQVWGSGSGGPCRRVRRTLTRHGDGRAASASPCGNGNSGSRDPVGGEGQHQDAASTSSGPLGFVAVLADPRASGCPRRRGRGCAHGWWLPTARTRGSSRGGGSLRRAWRRPRPSRHERRERGSPARVAAG